MTGRGSKHRCNLGVDVVANVPGGVEHEHRGNGDVEDGSDSFAFEEDVERYH